MKLYKFEAPWCQPCKQQKPMLDKLVADGLDLIVVDVSVQANSGMVADFNIRTLPTYVKATQGGYSNTYDERVGPQSEKIMRGWLGL